MIFTEYAELFVAALYHKTTLEDGEWYTFGDIVEEYQFPWKERWKRNLWEDLEDRGLVRLRGADEPSSRKEVALSGAGFRHIEQGPGADNVVAFLESYGLTHSHQRHSTDKGSDAEVGASRVDSSTWTGLPSDFELSEEKRTTLVAYLQEAESKLDSLGISNEAKAQARAYIIAAKVLADAPEPPSDVIWELVQRANSIAGIASLFVSVIGLFV